MLRLRITGGWERALQGDGTVLKCSFYYIQVWQGQQIDPESHNTTFEHLKCNPKLLNVKTTKKISTHTEKDNQQTSMTK